MKLRSFLLADAASVRESLLFMLGGGVSLVLRDTYPSSLPLFVVLSLELERSEVGSRIPLTITLVDPKGDTLGSTEAEFEILLDQNEAADPAVPIMTHFTLRLPGAVQGSGVHHVNVSVGDLIPPPWPLWVGPRSRLRQGAAKRKTSPSPKKPRR
jgi:hypothetical protein